MPANINNVNTQMGFTQAATVLNSIVEQATGKKQLTATSTANFVSQAQTALLTGTDVLMNAISQVLSRTIFSIRPYNAQFKGLMMNSQQWGNHVRKINFGASGVEDEERYDLTDGSSVDMYKVKKPSVLQTNWYSYDSYQSHITIFRDQLDMAFSGPEEFSRFITGVMTEMTNKLEQYREEFARMTLANYLGARINLGQVRHLLTEFATEYGIVDSATPPAPDPTAVLPTYLEPFTKWLFAQLKVLSKKFTERSKLFQANISGYDILRHTPKDRQRLYIWDDFMAKIDAQVLASVFNPNYLQMGDREEVSYWQSIETPNEIKVVPSQINTSTGAYAAGNSVTAKVLGVLMDYESVGITQVHNWMAATPFNAAGGYHNLYYHTDLRGFNDLTEKGIVLCLD